MPQTPHVAYLRVSTQKQGHLGLGMDAQRAIVRSYLGDDWPPVAEFVEVESGRKNSRPQLAAALAYCRRHGCKLVIAKLDRLARNVAFIANLMESKVEFVCADMPMVNKLTIHVLAAVAEEEADMISKRTKAALTAWKARNPDKRLGGPDGMPDAVIAAGRAARTQQAALRHEPFIDAVVEWRQDGKTLAEIAAKLTKMGFETARGGPWSPTQVSRVLASAEQQAPATTA